MNVSRYFVDRPVFAAVLSMAVFLAGLIALPLLPVSEYPEVVPPSIVVNLAYSSAPAPARTVDRLATDTIIPGFFFLFFFSFFY